MKNIFRNYSQKLFLKTIFEKITKKGMQFSIIFINNFFFFLLIVYKSNAHLDVI